MVANINTLIEDLTLFYHWGPREAEQLTPSELIRWRNAANRQAAQQNGETPTPVNETIDERNLRVMKESLAEQQRNLRGG